ncbi:MAG: hypothetical protein KUG79_07055 [Pseudomonadales bacterium]|nr:hypothetical protein [Pseudomonadales bacterium]
MLVSFVILAVILTGMSGWAQMQTVPPHKQALTQAWVQLKSLALRLPLALIAAGFIAQLLPQEQVVAYVGSESGITGILVAGVIGALLPGGPMVAFPLAVVLIEAGAGQAQMVSLITAWSALAFHRILSFEIPLMGAKFALRRYLLSVPLPIIAGLIALWII